MLGAAYGTVGDIEIMWTLIAVIGLGFGAFNLRDAWCDRKFLIANDIHNGRRVIANYAIRAEIARIIIQTIFTVAGILAMILPEPPRATSVDTAVVIGAVIRWGFIVSGALILFKSVDAYLTRHKLTGR
jgi:hypothetical protein